MVAFQLPAASDVRREEGRHTSQPRSIIYRRWVFLSRRGRILRVTSPIARYGYLEKSLQPIMEGDRCGLFVTSSLALLRAALPTLGCELRRRA